jgi:uncharacterized protein (DUF2252 family)
LAGGSPADRAARGKAARAHVPRSAHAAWSAAPDRADPVDLLVAEEDGRIPELIPIRHGRMLTSPFAYFRGAAGVMAADLAGTPVSGERVQLCGDAHLSNFGAFAAPDRRIVFDVDDFDETAPGPWEWDVKRLVASFVLAGRQRGLDRRRRQRVTSRAVRSYREAIRRFAQMPHLGVWYARLDVEDVVTRPWAGMTDARRRRLERNVAKAREKDSLRALARLTHTVGGAPRISSDPPLVVPIEDLLPADDRRDLGDALGALLGAYRESLPRDRARLLDGYRLVHLARKVVGVGSVGTRAWIALLLGRDDADPLFLQIKEANASVIEPYAGSAGVDNHGRRVVEGQRLMQAAGDIFLGWLSATGIDGQDRDFYVRQLWDCKRSAEIERMDARGLGLYAEACGWTLARAHARSGDRIAIAAYLGGRDRFDRAVTEFAEAYADQTERDYDAVAAAVRGGRIEAQEES